MTNCSNCKSYTEDTYHSKIMGMTYTNFSDSYVGIKVDKDSKAIGMDNSNGTNTTIRFGYCTNSECLGMNHTNGTNVTIMMNCHRSNCYALNGSNLENSTILMNCYESNCAFSNNTSGSFCKNCNITINCDEKSNCAGMPTCRLGTFYDNTATSCLVESDKTYGNSTVNRTLHNTNCTNCITYLNDQEMHEYVMNNVNCTNCLSETIAKKG